MGSREVKAAAAGDAASTGKVLSHEVRESGVIEIDDNAKQKYSRRKKKIPKRCPLLTLSNRTSSSVIVEALDDQLVRIESGILDDNASGDGSTSNLNSCAFPYYRSWCRGHCQDAVLVKDACVSCTALSPNFEAGEPKKSKGSSLERKLIKQLKTEYKDLSAITRKISAYTKDILSSITTKTGTKSSPRENIDENCSSNGDFATQPIAMQYFDKSGRPCLKLRLRDSEDLSGHRECQWFPNYRGIGNGPTETISPHGLGSIDEDSTNRSSSSIYNYLVFSRRHASTKSDSWSINNNSCRGIEPEK